MLRTLGQLDRRHALTLISSLVLPKKSVTSGRHLGGLNFFMGTPGGHKSGIEKQCTVPRLLSQ